MRLYLSGPMTGYPNNNFPEFHRLTAALREKGLEVVNPAELAVGVEPPDKSSTQWKEFYNNCLRCCIKELADCTAIALMPNWEKSNGAQLEQYVGYKLGLEIGRVEDFLNL